jgi:hypothetical protein
VLPRPTPHPCVTETFGARVVTVSLVTGNVYTTDLGPVGWWHRTLSHLWVWRTLNEARWRTRFADAERAVD